MLFLLALLLAWPTAGLSIVAYIAYFLFQSWLRAKTRMHHADKSSAQRAVVEGSTRLPSWFDNRKKQELFIEIIQQPAGHHNVPQNFLNDVLGNGNAAMQLMRYAGALEVEGASFKEQQIAVANKLIELWNERDQYKIET